MSDITNIHDHPQQKFWRYFSDRGLVKADVEQLGPELLSNVEARKQLPDDYLVKLWPGSFIRIPHIDRCGIDTGYAILRLLGEPPSSYPKKVKAIAPSKVRARAHFPRSNPPMTKGMTIFLCESVVKAEIVAKCGQYAIGINGCWGFSDRSNTDLLLPDIRDLPWPLIDRIHVFFDSNYATNDNVKGAASQFALRMKQALKFDNVFVTVLPPGETDWGVDDAFRTNGIEWVQEVLNSTPIEPELSELELKLHEMNKECVVLEETGMIVKYSQHPVIFMTKHNFTDVIYADHHVRGDKVYSIPRCWLTWPKHVRVPRMIMRPNEPKMVENEFLNLWVDPEIISGESSEVWAEFVDNMISDRESKKWLDQWIAHLVQRPGKKMMTYPILVGPAGVGKSMLTVAIAAILGEENCALVGQEDLESSYNGLTAVKLFTAINEFFAKDQGIGNKLKRIITETITVVNPKYGKQMTVDSVCNYMITTNELGALKLDEDDRRAGVVECSPIVNRRDDVEYFTRIAAEIRDNPSGILGYYHSIDLTGFNQYKTALVSEAKRDMTAQRRTGYETVAYDIVNDPDFFKDINVPDVKYISLLLLSTKQEVIEKLGIGLYDKAVGNKLNAAFRKMGVLTWKGNTTGQMMFNGVKHRIYILPGGVRDANEATIRLDLQKWSKC